MANPRNNNPPATSCRYRVIVGGVLDPSWSDWFDGMDITTQLTQAGQSLTVFTGTIMDQAALRGILNRLWDLNMHLLSVRWLPTVAEEDDRISEPVEIDFE